jgi:LPXTG-site transpeptidase (sortase) family protein
MIPDTEQQKLGQRNRLFLRWTWWILILLGALAVSYVVLMLLYAKSYQEVANTALVQQMRAKEQRNVRPSIDAPKEGDVLGRIEIPRLGLMVAILEGTRSRTLNVGVGHIKGTALPGEQGNIGIAGHRDTYFRALKDIQSGDEIRIQTATGLSRYKVDRVQIVAPDDIQVLVPSASSAITLVTCYPFYFIGAAPQRYVVHAYQQ